MEQYIESIKKE